MVGSENSHPTVADNKPLKRILLSLSLVTTLLVIMGPRKASALYIPETEPQQDLIPLLVQEKPKKQEVITYTVRKGDTLVGIARAHQTSWERLYYANNNIKHPDEIKPSEVLRIPRRNEKLKKRDIIIYANPGVGTTYVKRSRQNSGGFSSSGLFNNTGGWCTNYAALRHPVPSWFQNADMWLINARQAGMATGVTPRVGAVAVAASYMHVAIIERVEDGRVFVSEQNYEGFGVVSSRWTPTSEWQGYIY